MKLILLLLTTLLTHYSFSQDSIKVRIIKIEKKDSITTVTMKSKNAWYKTSCTCEVPYKEKDIVYIKKP